VREHWPPQTGTNASAERVDGERRRAEEERRRREPERRRAIFEEHIRPNTLKALAAATPNAERSKATCFWKRD